MDQSAGNDLNPRDVMEMTVEIATSYVSNNNVRASELPDLIKTIHASLTGIAAPEAAQVPEPELKPAVPIKKSVTDEYIISLEDGRKFKSMKRYLSGLGMTPDEYRQKWGLPSSYPMVAPGYAARRSELAKASGLGSSRRLSGAGVQVDEEDESEAEPIAAQPEEQAEAAPVATAEPAPEPAAEAAPKKRGRAKKEG